MKLVFLFLAFFRDQWSLSCLAVSYFLEIDLYGSNTNDFVIDKL